MAAWPNLSDLISPAFRDSAVALLGVPLAAGSVTPGACDRAPDVLRQTLKRIGRYDVETGRELQTQVLDRGDVMIPGATIEDATPAMCESVASAAGTHALTLLVGGNNAVTRPAVLALGAELDSVGLITLDAHFDMRDLDQGLGNGNPVRALIWDGLPRRTISRRWALLRSRISRAMHEDALEAGNLVITSEDVRNSGIAACHRAGARPRLALRCLW